MCSCKDIGQNKVFWKDYNISYMKDNFNGNIANQTVNLSVIIPCRFVYMNVLGVVSRILIVHSYRKIFST